MMRSTMKPSLITVFWFFVVLILTLRANEAAATSEEKEENNVEVSPECAAVLLVGGAAAGGATAYALVAPLLALLGFTAAGVAGGSFASWWQSNLSMILAGSMFATLQSIAMAGAGPGVIALGSSLGAATQAAFVEDICARVDAVDPDSATGLTIATTLATVQKAESVKSWASSAKEWVGGMLVDIGKSLQTDNDKDEE